MPFIERAHIEILEFAQGGSEGHVKLRIPFEGNQNHVGVMYAGSQFTFAEFSALPLTLSAFGMDILERFVPHVDNFEIKYFKPVNCDLYTTLTLTADQVASYQSDMQNRLMAVISLQNDLVDEEGT